MSEDCVASTKMSTFQEECNKILNNDSLFEEDKVDLLEDLVLKKYKCSSKEAEKIILDILWKHKDPFKKTERKAKIVGVQDIQTKIDIPSFERRLELEKQVRELEALNEKSREQKQKNKTSNVKSEIENEYNALLEKTQNLRNELYDERKQAPTITSSPIDQISDMFNGSLPRHRIEQSLKANGYDIIEAASHLMSQLKATEDQVATQSPQPNTAEPFFSVDKKNKTLCSFFIKNGTCLRADCKFSHDIDSRVCSFWLKGNCLAGESCLFKHGFDLSNAPLTPPTFSATPVASGSITGSPIVTASTSPASNIGTIPSFVPSKAIKIETPIRKPDLIPWENTSNYDYFKSYINNRNNASKNEFQRRKFAKMSTESWKNNNAFKAKQLSEKASKFEEISVEALKLADDDLYNYSETVDKEVWFEMHGLEFNDAVEQLDGNISEVKSKEKSNSKIVYIVVPSTSDVAGYKKTTKPITIWLDHAGYRWQLFGCGNGVYGSVIGIDPWSI